ncbi:MAG: tRNA pseudouridine(13) synthase TruD, partial [Planctomycetota bacterium]|nr:tRNA pseudouridine(13) synthase TruD [Planctomycetota bacterium]
MTAPEWAPGYRHRTHAIAPIPLEFKASPEDFVVEELPLAPPEGTGDVAWIWLEKRGLSTVEAVRRLAVALGVEPNQASFAGRKDVLAVTRQWVTVQGVDLDRAHGIEGRGWRVLAIERGEHALRMGRLAGNRFELVLHATREEDRGAVGEVLDALCSQGMPNYYGSQRFGRNGRGQDLARHLLAGDVDAYLEAYLGGEGEAAEELLRLIREGTWGERRKANELCGSLDASRAEVARQLARRPKDMDWLVRSIPLRDRRFQLSALQAVVFNRVVAERMAGGVLDVLWEGDVVRDPGGDWRTVEAELDPAPLPG